jgi:hypothetical protein
MSVHGKPNKKIEKFAQFLFHQLHTFVQTDGVANWETFERADGN